MIDVGSAVGYLLLDTSQWESGFRAARTGLKTFTDETSSATDKWSAAGKLMGSTGKALTLGVTAPLMGLGAASLKVGNEFEAQMSRVKSISGAAEEDFASLTNTALELGASTSFSAGEAAQGMENLASAGFNAQQIIAAMPGLLDLAASSGADLATATDYAASTLNAFGMQADEAGRVADVFAKASADTNAQVEDMGEAMKYIAPVAAAMNQDFEMVSAAIGIMANAGIKGSQAGTSLRGAFSRLAKPTEQMTKTMEALGLSFYDSEGNMLKLDEIILQLETNMAGLTQEQRNQALVTLFGQESLSGMLALIESGSGGINEMTQSLKDSTGAAAEMADVMLDNTSGAIEEMFGSIETLAIKIQQVLAPVVTKAVQGVTEFVNWLSSLDEGTLQLIVTIGAFLAAAGPLLIFISKLISAGMTIAPLISTVGGALTALATGPIGLVITTLGLLLAAWATNFGGIRDVVTATLELIKTTVAKWSSELVEAFKKTVQWIREALSNKWKEVIKWFKDALETAKNTVLSAKSAFYNAGKAIFTALWDGLKSLWTKVSGWFREKIEWISDKVQFWNNESNKLSSSPVPESSKGSYASGLDYVPRDMDVRVHRGETIVTQEGTNELIEAIKNIPRGGGGPMTVIVKIGDKTIKETAIDGINEASMMSGRKIITV